MFEIGTSLREARLRRELDFPALEAITKVRAKYLRALEDERFEVLPSHTYIKGFLRSYADSLGLDGQLYVDEYNSRYVSVLDDDAPVRQRRPVPAARRRRQERRESNVVLLALTAIALVTALVIAAWKFGGPDTTNVNGLRQHAAPTTSAKPVLGTTTPAKPVAKQIVLVVRAARGDSWMEVRASAPSGRLLYGGTLERGQSKLFTSTALYVSFGAPENVTLKVNGKAVNVPRGGAFRLSRAGLVPAGPA